jgi:hypothetical protein
MLLKIFWIKKIIMFYHYKKIIHF